MVHTLILTKDVTNSPPHLVRESHVLWNVHRGVLCKVQ